MSEGNQNTPAPSNGQPRNIILQPNQIRELTAKFKALVNEAKEVGENTQRGKELLIQASKLKAMYDNYNRQRQQQLQQQQAVNNKVQNPSNNDNVTTNNSFASPSSPPTSGSTISNSSSTQLANIMRQVLTDEQNANFDKLDQTFRSRASALKDKHTFLKQNIERLTQEINKQADNVNARKQLEEKRGELLRNLKAITMEHNTLYQKYQNGKKASFLY